MEISPRGNLGGGGKYRLRNPVKINTACPVTWEGKRPQDFSGRALTASGCSLWQGGVGPVEQPGVTSEAWALLPSLHVLRF